MEAASGGNILCESPVDENIRASISSNSISSSALSTLASLLQFPPSTSKVYISLIASCHTRALEISADFERFSKFLNFEVDSGDGRERLETESPRIVIGTPARILSLLSSTKIPPELVKSVVLDDCNDMLARGDMKKEMEQVLESVPQEKQIMMMLTSSPNTELRSTIRKVEAGGSFSTDLFLLSVHVWWRGSSILQASPARTSLLSSPQS